MAKDTLLKIENLLLRARSVLPVVGLPIKMASGLGVLEFWSIGVLEKS